MALELIVRLIGAALLAQSSVPPKAITDQLAEKERLLADLRELSRRVKSGDLPGELELARGRVSREEVLAGLDVRGATKLGVGATRVRDRVVPGFAAELRLLADQRVALATGPLAEPSPLLTVVLDLEQELFQEADRRRARLGLKSPFTSGPLAAREGAPMPATSTQPLASAPKETSEAAAGSQKSALRRVDDPRLLGQALYRAGRFGEALAQWKDLASPEGDGGLELEFARADCLLKTGQVDDAITTWQKLATDHPKSSWGQQAEFELKVARALVSMRKAKDPGRHR